MKELSINNRRYLGSKYKLLDFIESTINDNCKNVKSVVDIFGGTGVVASHFFDKNKEIYVNDILKSNYYSYVSWFGKEKVDKEKIYKIISNYNNLKDIKDNYFSENFKNTYFSYEDCKKIGFIRDDINKKFDNHQLNEREKSILITSLIYSMDRIANTVGHYDAYRKKEKLDNNFYMYMIDVQEDTNNKKVHIYNSDSNKIIKEIKADLVYIDPPYNSRQYSDAYHLLENVATWNKPTVYGVAKKMNRDKLKSDYCTNRAVKAFEDLIDSCNSKYILVSYNNTGNNANERSNAKISDLEIKEILGKKGNVKVFEQPYNNFTTGKGKSNNHKERLFLCEVSDKSAYNQLLIHDTDEYAKSPLNFTGGKFKLLSQLNNRFPKEIDTFVDFFCGGANVSANVKANKIIAIDKDKNLIRLLDLFKNNNYMDIINKIDEIIEKYNLSNTYKYGYNHYNCDSSVGLGMYNKNNYLKLRCDYNSIEKCSIEKDLMLLTLIIYGFNHQIRFNSKGKFNNPVGKRDFNSSIRQNLLKFCEKIDTRNIEFINNDYKNFDVKELDSRDFCYFDPPYFLGDASYNENNGWNVENERELLDYINQINEKHIKFALSNVIEHHGKKNDLLINWAIKNKYNINYLNYSYSNSNYQQKNKDSNSIEVLITNY